MIVTKRNGKVEDFNFAKVRKVIDFATNGNEKMAEEFIKDLHMNLKSVMTSEEIQNTLIRVASEKIEATDPQWQFVASKFVAYDLIKRAGISRGYKKFGYGDYAKLVRVLVSNGLYSEQLLQGYTREQLEEISTWIDPTRDDLLTYASIVTLKNRYLFKGYKGEVYELPQERFMTFALYTGLAEKPEKRMEYVKNEYDRISKHRFMTATPTLMNSGKQNAQLSSCFILDIDDDLWSIYDTNKISAMLSKNAGGIGMYIGEVRGRGASIQNHKGASNGIIPWIKGYENTAQSCNQLGARAGAFAIYNDMWHIDTPDFLELRMAGGDERLKAFHVHHGLCVPDLFMKIREEKGTWYLMDPHEIEQVKGYKLNRFFKEEFEARYWDCVNDDRITKKPIDANKLWVRFLQVAYAKGEPYLYFRDRCFEDNPNKHAGNPFSSNLCTEIIQNMSITTFEEEVVDYETGMRTTRAKLGDNVVCNLSSTHLGKIADYEEYGFMSEEEYLEDTLYWQVRALDNVIDMNYYPVKDTEYTNKRYRAIGVGQMDYHNYLAQRGIAWESEAHLEATDRLYENIAFYTIKASHLLAIEKGAYPLFKGSDWNTGDYFVRKGYVARNENGDIVAIEGKERWYDLCLAVMTKGIRNGYLLATAPTGTISIIANATATTDPIFGKKFMEGKGDNVLPVVSNGLNEKTWWLMKEAHLIDQIWSVRAMGIRQRHIDQSGSFNIYVPTGVSAKTLNGIYTTAWKEKLKTTYYLRSKTLTPEECESCQ